MKEILGDLEAIKTQIPTTNLDVTLNKLYSVASSFRSKYTNQILIFQYNYRQYLREKTLGVIEEQTSSVAVNKILRNTLELIDLIREEASALEVNPIHLTLSDVDLAKENQRSEWMVFEIAFLMFDFAPPDVHDHFYLMDDKISKLKNKLHEDINSGLLKISREYKFDYGLTRYVALDDLLEYASKYAFKPKFLTERK